MIRIVRIPRWSNLPRQGLTTTGGILCCADIEPTQVRARIARHMDLFNLHVVGGIRLSLSEHGASSNEGPFHTLNLRRLR